MANNIKGITVEIGGNTGPLTSALEGVNKKAGDLQYELNQVNRQLKFDPTNVDLLRQKEELTSQTAQALKEKQDILKQAVEQAHAAFEKGDLGADKVRAVEREYAKVSSQIKDLESGHTSLFSKITDKLNITKENVKTAIGTIGIAVGGFLKSSIDEAKEAGNSQANLAQTIKSTGGAAGMTVQQLNNLADSLQAATTFDDDAIKSGEGMLLTFTKIGKDVFPQAAQATLDMSQKMGTEPKQAAMQLGKALNDPIKGITALTRVGVSFSASQKETIKQMMKTGDIAGAQKVILAELNKEFGGQAAAAAKTYDGQMKQNENTLKNIKETIGTALLPVLAQLGSYLAMILRPMASFITAHPKIAAGILAVIAVVGTLIGGMSVLNTVLSVFNITAQIGAASLLPTLGLVAIAVVGVAVAAALIIKNWGPISSFFKNLWDGIKSTTVNTWNGITSFFVNTWNGINNTAASIWNGIGNFFKNLWNGIKITAESVWNGIKTVFITIWNGIKTAVMAIVTPFIQGILNLWNGMETGITTVMNGIKMYLSGIWLAIKTIVLGPVLLIIDLVTGNFKKLSTDTQGIFNNLKQAFGLIWNGIKQIFTGVIQAIAGFCKVEWTGMVNTGKSIWNGFKAFMSSLWNGIKQIAVSAWNGIKSFFSSTWNGTISTGKSIWNGFKSFFTSLWNGLVNFIRELPSKFASGVRNIGSAIVSGFNSAISFIKNLPSNMLKWGKDMIDGLIRGIKSKVSSVGSAVSSVGDKIRSFLHFSTPDEGPLKDYEKWMPDFIGGLAKGIEANKYKVQNAIRGLATDINVGVNPSIMRQPATAGTAGNTAVQNSFDALLHTDNITINSDMDIQDIAYKLNFYMQQLSSGKGTRYNV